MKKICISLFVMFVSVFAFSQWVTIGNDLGKAYYSVYFTSIDTGYIAGNITNSNVRQGLVLKTTNRGVGWNFIKINDIYPSQYLSVHFPDAYTGYVVGWEGIPSNRGIILKTTNSGTNWSLLISGINSCFNSVYFSMPITDVLSEQVE